MSYLRIFIFVAIASLLSCNSGPEAPLSADVFAKANNPEWVHRGIKRLSIIIRHDKFPPPVASRIFAYSSISAYEAMAPGYPEYQSLAGQLNGLTPCPQPEAGKTYCYPLAGVNAMLVTGKTLIFTEGQMEDLKEDILAEFQAMNMPKEVYDRSMQYGEAVAKHILAWSKTDNYAKTRSLPKFSITNKEDARWRPTPPAYEDALEPYWNTIRPWVMTAPDQFKPAPPITFSTEKGSDFYKQAYEVYQIVNTLSPQDSATAWYWDDNPFAIETTGHLTFARKKNSPGVHWMLIATGACRQANADLIRSAETYVRVSTAVADGFINSWDEKFRSVLIRPESYINQHIDPEWQPLIQTPPFPEHTSGHSTISSAAATVLTLMYGDNVNFTDSSEVEFGFPTRSFTSYRAAADEVGMSRMYGGIHYRHGNVEGLKSGAKIGEYVMSKLKTKVKS